MTTSIQCTNVRCSVYRTCRIKDFAENCSVHNEYIANKTVRLRVVKGPGGCESAGGTHFNEMHVECVHLCN